MRTLVYTGCYGDPAYAEMTRLLVASLRGPGRYGGEIAVLTDGAFEENGQDVRIVRDDGAHDAFAVKCAKARAASLLDGERYDRILWLDADMVAIRDVAPLFAHAREDLCAGDEYPFNTLRAASVGGALSWWERLRHLRTWGINAGCFCLPGSAFRSTLDLWREEILRFRPRMRRWVDQPPLNALIARRRIRFTPYPRGWIELPPLYESLGRGRRFTLGPGTKLLHFCGFRDKRETLRRMRAAGAPSKRGSGGKGEPPGRDRQPRRTALP